MFNVGGPEVLVILLVALIVLGPQQLPKAARTMSNALNEVKKASSGFQSELRSALDVTGSETPTPERPATTMADADVTETVVSTIDETGTVTDEPVPGAPSSAADRAAG